MNVKIYHWDISKKDEDTQTQIRENMSFKLTVNGGNLTFDIKMPFKGDVREFPKFTFNAEENKGKIFELLGVETSEYAVLKAISTYEYVDRFNGYNIPNSWGKSFDKVKVARLIVDDNGDVFIAMTWYCDDIEGFENVTMNQDEQTTKSYLVADCQWYKERAEFLDKKKKLITKTDVYRNVSYLEAQVDLLTRLVISLMDGTATKMDYLTALKVADEYSVLDIKELDAVKSEFSDNKKNFRELQKEYYEEIK